MCVKHVPDTQSDRRIDDGCIVRGEDDVLNELDENAIEEAVSLCEKHGGEVIALTMGPEDAQDALIRALQMGADRGVLISDDHLESADAVGTAAVLAAAIRALHAETPVDLVATGMASLDAMTSMLPAALAANLGYPMLGLAHQLDLNLDSKSVQIARDTDGYEEVLRASLPAVVSVTDQINEPRYPAFAAMKAARSKPMDQWNLDDIAPHLDQSFVQSKPARVHVVDAHQTTRDTEPVIVTDSGHGGVRLAQYILEVVK